MPQFRKKPVVIEAMQYDGNAAEIMIWARKSDVVINGGFGKLEIPTLEGVVIASHKDWVIRGVAGEFYPCKPDIFAATYEPA